jgi:hypothetical protein
MKTIVLNVMAAALILAGGATSARGTKPSSFVPRGPEPHSTLADVHGRKSAHKTLHRNAGAVHKPTASRAKSH